MADFGDVIEFWFAESGPEKWWVKDPDFDRLIERRFGRIHRQAIDLSRNKACTRRRTASRIDSADNDKAHSNNEVVT